MLKEFRRFILRGNLVDLATAVVLGTAFGAVVTALVKDLVTPMIAAVGGKPDFKPVNTLMTRYRPEPAPDRETRDCPECLSSIPTAARRCAFCTAEQPA